MRNATTEVRKESGIAYAQKASVVTGVLPVEQKACVGKKPVNDDDEQAWPVVKPRVAK